MTSTLTRPTESQLRGFTREGVEALSRAKGEPDWLLERRLAAWEVYEATPMPTQQDEEWRRTSLRALKLDQVQPFGPQPAIVDSLDALPAAVREGVSLEGRAGLLVVQEAGGVVTDAFGPDLPAIREWADAIRRDVTEHDRLTLRVDVVQETTGVPGAEDPETIVLRQQRSLRRARRVDTIEAGLAGACDGELTIGEILDALAVLTDRDPADLRSTYLPRVREMVVEGFLVAG